MRKLLIVVAVVFAISVFATVLEAATSKCPAGSKPVVRCVKPKVKARVHHVKKRSMPARYARGPIINVPKSPAPIVNVPAQAAPVVNVPEQPAPVVNVAAPPPGVGITTDANMIYIVRGDQLLVLDKCTYCVKQTVKLE